LSEADQVHHVFNSSLVSGPETLVLPNLVGFSRPSAVVLLQESRLPKGAATVSQYAVSLGFQTHEIPVHRRFDLGAVSALTELWTRHRPGIVHAHGPKASLHALLAVRRFPRSSRPRLVTTHHGVRANDQSLKLKFFELVYEKTVIPFYDLCLTVCTSDRDLLIRRGLRDAKIEIHLNGVDRPEVSAADRAAARRSVRKVWAALPGGPPDEGFLVGVVARLSVEKRHDAILRAMAVLGREHPGLNARLACFGSGPLEGGLRDLSVRLGVDSRVHWMGYRSGIAAEMVGLDTLLSLSMAEGLPINLVEAGWCGTPVIAQAVDGVRDLIEDGKSGILLEPPASEDRVVRAVRDLAMDPSQAARLGSGLQERVREKFSKKAWVERLESIYDRLEAGF